MNNLKRKTISGFFYKLAERGSAQTVQFVVQIVLARILMPEQFGTVALLTVLIRILDVFVTSGFGNALVVNKKSDNIDFSTCFYFSLSIALVLYGLVFITAPYISTYFYGREELTLLLRVMALQLLIAAFNSVQHAYVAKHMIFKLFFYSTLSGTVISGIVSIVMAYCGFGVWALVVQYLSSTLINTVVLWFCTRWRPILTFSFQRLKAIFDYGWKILVVGLIDTIYTQLRSLVIAKGYTKEDLAFYNRGTNFPAFGMHFLEPTITGVLFPSLSSCNDDQSMMKSITRRIVTTSTYIVFPMMFLLAATAKPLVMVLLTSKWESCVMFLQIGCVAYMLRPLQVINDSVIRASGKSGLLLKLNLIKKGIGVILLIVSVRYGVIAIAFSYVLTNIVSTFINIYPNRGILNYGYREQFKDIIGLFFLSVIMFACIMPMTLLPIGYLPMLVIQLVVGVVVYWGLSVVFKVNPYLYIKNLIVKYIYHSKSK